jgi:cardiolipin synthase A/B
LSHQALKGGVNVLLLMPAEPDVICPVGHERLTFLKGREELGTYETFTLAGIAGMGADGRRKPIYVHAKLHVG